MKMTNRLATTLLLLAIPAFSACSSMGGEKEAPEVKVSAEQLPPAVRATLTREAGGTAITEADKQTDGGKTIYEADAVINGVTYEIKVAEDGTLISKAVDNEAEPATKPAK